MTPPRRGTAIIDQGKFLLKKSIDAQKIENEFRYFQNLPQQLRSFHPTVQRTADFQEGAYLIEKISCRDAGIVFASESEFPAAFVAALLKELQRFLSKCPRQQVSPKDFVEAIDVELGQRLASRIQLILKSSALPLLLKEVKGHGYSGLGEVAEDLVMRARKQADCVPSPQLIFSHGDLCFSNLLLHKTLYLIDPRGQQDNKPHFSSEYYDFAKISQCLEGHYDFINYSLAEPTGQFQRQAREVADAFFAERKADRVLVKLFEASHFVAMIPFHDEDPTKVLRFLQRALKILRDLKT